MFYVMKLTTNWMLLAIVLGAVTVTSVTAVITDVDDLTVNDTTQGDGTAFTIRTDSVTPGAEATFLFSHNGKGPAEAWRMRIQDTSDGLSFVHIGTGEKMRILTTGNIGIDNALPQEKLDINGNIRLSGANSKIISTGDICIGTCP